ncbi:MAG: hypothetical protein K2X03_26135 [Bryobacteraceae bacterium]|nr:hypothetical protein [Bryobacteraceae bacterium]
MHHRVASIALLTLLAGTPGCQTVPVEDSNRYRTVKNYWEWGNYWDTLGLDFPKATYRPGASFRALVFSSQTVNDAEPFWGFCGVAAGVCQAYWTRTDSVIEVSSATLIRPNETNEQAFQRFQRQSFREEEEAAGPTAGPRVLTETRNVTLPNLGVPEATRLKRRNSFYRELGQVESARLRVPHFSTFRGCAVFGDSRTY